MSLFIVWLDGSGRPMNSDDLQLGILFPQVLTSMSLLQLQSTAVLPSPFTLQNIKFYLKGNTAQVALLQSWAPNAGLDISFDLGASWTRFSPTAGKQSDRSTWIPMAGTAVSPVAPDGQLTYDDTAQIALRVQTPISVSTFGLYEVTLGIDFDVF